MLRKTYSITVLALLVVSILTWYRIHRVDASVNLRLVDKSGTAKDPKGSALGDTPPAAMLSKPTSSTRAYGWSQFANFLRVLQGFSIPNSALKTDQDWGTASTWTTKCQVGLVLVADCNSPAIRDTFTTKFPAPRFERPVQLTLPPIVFNPDTPEGEMVLYNAAASQHIVQTLNPKQVKAGYPAPSQAGFTDGSVIVKETWEFVPSSGIVVVFDRDSDSFTKPPNPNPLGSPPPDISPFGGYQFMANWHTHVKVISSAESSSAGCPAGTGNLTSTPLEHASVSLPLSCFVHQEIDKKLYVLLGVNMIHKVKDEWKWTTAWWTFNPAGDTEAQFNLDRPGYLNKLSHYDLDVTTGDNGQACFNPYLEGPSPNGAHTNCVRCHQFAAEGIPMFKGTSTNTGSSSIPMQPGVVTNYLAQPNVVGTDSVWGLATSPPPQPTNK